MQRNRSIFFDLLLMYYIDFGGTDWFVCRKFGTFIPKLLCITKILWVVEVHVFLLFTLFIEKYTLGFKLLLALLL